MLLSKNSLTFVLDNWTKLRLAYFGFRLLDHRITSLKSTRNNTSDDGRISELRAREDATRRRLALLKQEMALESSRISQTSSTNSLPRKSTTVSGIVSSSSSSISSTTDPSFPPKITHRYDSTLPSCQDNGCKPISNNQQSLRSHDIPFPSKAESPNKIQHSQTNSHLISSSKKAVYMTGVKEQRARVHRIRQAIIAAEVIQRAWRRYRSRKVRS